MKALVTYEFTEKEFQSLRDLGYDVVYKKERELEFSKDIKDIDVLVGLNPFRNLDMDLFPKLKLIQLIITGINHVPEDKVTKNNIILSNNRGGYSIPISEWIVLKILEMLKNSKEFQAKQRNKIWKSDNSLVELNSKTVGILGTGSIAREAAKRLKPFGVKILGINTDGRPVEGFDETASFKDITSVVPKVDILVLASAYTEETHHIIDESIFAEMKDGSYLVNISRGSIVDEKALIENLKSRKIKKAALDVFEKEPLPEDSPLWDMDNVYLTPHNSWGSEMDRKRKFNIAYRNLKNYINGEELENVIDFDKGY